jgi:hypothetical protein
MNYQYSGLEDWNQVVVQSTPSSLQLVIQRRLRADQLGCFNDDEFKHRVRRRKMVGGTSTVLVGYYSTSHDQYLP